MLGTIVSLDIEEGDAVSVGQQLLVMEAMKMQHVVKATTGGTIRMINIAPGDTVYEGHPLIFVEPGEETGEAVAIESEIDLDEIRPDLAEVLDRQAILTDERRPDAVARRRRTNQRTTRENIDAARRSRHLRGIWRARRRRAPAHGRLERADPHHTGRRR